jgi:hypothetical protein
VQAVVGRLDEPLRRELFARFSDGLWCSSQAIATALERFDKELGAGDHAHAAQAGRHFARAHHYASETEESLRALPPELFFSTAPELFGRYFASGRARVLKVGRGYGRLEVREQTAPKLALAVAMLGVLEAGLKLHGAAAVAVRLSKASALGDGADVYEATWRT